MLISSTLNKMIVEIASSGNTELWLEHYEDLRHVIIYEQYQTK